MTTKETRRDEQMAGFTPGPWSVEECIGFPDWMVVGPAAEAVAEVYHQGSQTEANAHLIAAAPELYEALKDLVEVLRREAPGTPLNNTRFDALGIKANNALAKAAGHGRG